MVSQWGQYLENSEGWPEIRPYIQSALTYYQGYNMQTEALEGKA